MRPTWRCRRPCEDPVAQLSAFCVMHVNCKLSTLKRTSLVQPGLANRVAPTCRFVVRTQLRKSSKRATAWPRGRRPSQTPAECALAACASAHDGDVCCYRFSNVDPPGYDRPSRGMPRPRSYRGRVSAAVEEQKSTSGSRSRGIPRYTQTFIIHVRGLGQGCSAAE